MYKTYQEIIKETSNRVAINIDDTLVDMLPRWYDWVYSNYGDKLPSLHKVEFLNSEIYRAYIMSIMLDKGVDLLDYWRKDNLYDDLTMLDTVDGSIKFICEIIKLGYTPVFVTHVTMGHEGSKFSFIAHIMNCINGILGISHPVYICDLPPEETYNIAPVIAIDDNLVALAGYRTVDGCRVIRRSVGATVPYLDMSYESIKTFNEISLDSIPKLV